MDNTRKKSVTTRISLPVYAHAFAQMPDYLYLLDNNCVLLDCNDNFLNLLGLDTINKETVDSVYTMMAQLGLWTEHQTQIFKQNDINTILSGTVKTDELELPVFDKNGHIIYFKASRIPLIDDSGAVLGLLVIIQDITHQKYQSGQLETIRRELHTHNAQERQPTKAELTFFEQKYSPKILLIEDNTIAQQAAKSVLMSCNCVVDAVINEAQFDEVFKPGNYDLVFMDIGLENTSGYAFAKQLRKKEQGSGHKVPIIALTGFDPELVSLDCGYYDMEGAIGKPLKASQVRQILQHYIHHIDIDVIGLEQVKAEA